MSENETSVTMVSYVESYAQAISAKQTFHCSSPAVSQLLIIGPPELIGELRRHPEAPESVRYAPEELSNQDLQRLIRTEYSLVLPVSAAGVVLGTDQAVGLLRRHPDMQAVGGLTLDPGGAIRSGAFRTVHRIGTQKLSIAPVEALEPLWTKEGEFALTPADHLGGLLLLRTDLVTVGLLKSRGSIERAVNSLGVDGDCERAVFSGLVLRTLTSSEPSLGNSGDIRELVGNLYQIWSDLNLSEVTVLHQGSVRRLDLPAQVVYLPDFRRAQVDGGGTRQGYDPTFYYSSESHLSQLGPGFGHLYRTLTRGTNSAFMRNPGSKVVELSQLEVSLLSKVRQVGRALPTTWVYGLRIFLFRLLRLQKI